ncbi:zinc ribbon domain-containing protein [Thermoanaerobacterium sp. RBIITD]|uniref:zinc ribbon domain-containing protein n=1 Tax=Thermoanaerobacterium sp. RBIITD TaxID=1550240 RepID=UPI000BB8D054|nr:zinc ribbon domain-containing protein [Thermoanaerobacterium sp. RBIITD]SNX53669.1 Double zinc ribbon [Thermoanaerobacterium sp. RBIITD]
MKYYWLLLLFTLLLSQATWIFIDARKRGEKYYWLWGLFGLLNIPSSLIIYLLVTRHGESKCTKCGSSIKSNYNYCPFCGNNLKPSICTKCGMEIKDNWIYCPNCSKKLKEE